MMEASNQALTVDKRDHDMAVCRLDALIDHQHVAIENLGFSHIIPPDLEEKTGVAVTDKVVMDIKTCPLILASRCRRGFGTAVGQRRLPLACSLALWPLNFGACFRRRTWRGTDNADEGKRKLGRHSLYDCK
jgi:hypothetical protein